MKIFRHRNRNNITGPNNSDKAANWLAARIQTAQSLWAKGMAKLFDHLSPLGKKTVLVVVCIVMVAYSTLLIASGIGKSGMLLLKPASIVRPLATEGRYQVLPTELPPAIKRIERFRLYLDSLRSTENGRKIRDSILQHRPGLMDSIRNIEKVYCSGPSLINKTSRQ